MVIENWIFRIGGLILAAVLLFIIKDEDASVPRKTSIPSAIIYIVFVLIQFTSIFLYGMESFYIYSIIIYSLTASAWIAIIKWG